MFADALTLQVKEENVRVINRTVDGVDTPFWGDRTWSEGTLAKQDR